MEVLCTSVEIKSDDFYNSIKVPKYIVYIYTVCVLNVVFPSACSTCAAVRRPVAYGCIIVSDPHK